MHTIIKHRHRFSYVKWNTVTFVCAHFLRQVQASTLKGFILTENSGLAVLTKQHTSSGYVSYLKYLASGTQGVPHFHSKLVVKLEASVSSAAVHVHRHQMEG